jgi:hypothetical protein
MARLGALHARLNRPDSNRTDVSRDTGARAGDTQTACCPGTGMIDLGIGRSMTKRSVARMTAAGLFHRAQGKFLPFATTLRQSARRATTAQASHDTTHTGAEPNAVRGPRQTRRFGPTNKQETTTYYRSERSSDRCPVIHAWLTWPRSNSERPRLRRTRVTPNPAPTIATRNAMMIKLVTGGRVFDLGSL